MIVFGLTGTAILIGSIGLVASLATAVALMSAVIFESIQNRGVLMELG
jgi:hypothetical protein